MKAAYTAPLADKLIATAQDGQLPSGDQLILALANAYNRGRAIAVGELGPSARGGLGLPDIEKVLIRARAAMPSVRDRAAAEAIVRQAVLDCGLAGYSAQLSFSYTSAD